MSSRRTNSASLQAFRFKAPMPAVRAAATVMDNRFPNMYSENLVVCTFKISESRLVTKGKQGVHEVRRCGSLSYTSLSHALKRRW